MTGKCDSTPQKAVGRYVRGGWNSTLEESMPGLANGPVTTEAVRTGRTNSMETEGAKAGAGVGQQPCATGQLLCSHSFWCTSNERGKATIVSPTRRHTTNTMTLRPPPEDIHLWIRLHIRVESYASDTTLSRRPGISTDFRGVRYLLYQCNSKVGTGASAIYYTF
jgi:hypothetical protein